MDTITQSPLGSLWPRDSSEKMPWRACKGYKQQPRTGVELTSLWGMLLSGPIPWGRWVSHDHTGWRGVCSVRDWRHQLHGATWTWPLCSRGNAICSELIPVVYHSQCLYPYSLPSSWNRLGKVHAPFQQSKGFLSSSNLEVICGEISFWDHFLIFKVYRESLKGTSLCFFPASFFPP